MEFIMDRREELLQGIISFPQQIMDFMNPNEEQKILIKGIWDALCFTYLSDKNVSAIVWSEMKNILINFLNIFVILVG